MKNLFLVFIVATMFSVASQANYTNKACDLVNEKSVICDVTGIISGGEPLVSKLAVINGVAVKSNFTRPCEVINQQFFYATLVSSLAPFGSSVRAQLSATAKDPLYGPSAIFHDELGIDADENYVINFEPDDGNFPITELDTIKIPGPQANMRGRESES